MYTYLINIKLKDEEDGINYQNVQYYADQVIANEFTYGERYDGPISEAALYEWNFYFEAPQALLTVARDEQGRLFATHLNFFGTPDTEQYFKFNTPVYIIEPPLSARNPIKITMDKENFFSSEILPQGEVQEEDSSMDTFCFLYR